MASHGSPISEHISDGDRLPLCTTKGDPLDGLGQENETQIADDTRG